MEKMEYQNTVQKQHRDVIEGLRDLDANNVRELENKIQEITELQEKLENRNHYIHELKVQME